MQAQRFIIENNGADVANVRTLFEHAAAYCLRKGVGQITLVVPVKSSFPDTILADYLGTTVARSLSRGAHVSLVKGLDLSLAVPSQLSAQGEHGLTLAVYLTAADLAVVDATPSIKALAYLPWTETEGRSWMALWAPHTWGTANWAVPPLELPGPVERELARLTRIVNLSTGLSHPSDKESATRVFKGLHLEGYRLDPEHIKGWAIKHGWRAHHADDLAQLGCKFCT